jgi:hypothetical protein
MASLQLFNILQFIAQHVSFRWFWRGKPQGAGEMENAIAIRPIGLHKYKKPDQIRELEDIFFGPADSKVISRLKPVAKTFVKKVRKAMGVDEL